MASNVTPTPASPRASAPAQPVKEETTTTTATVAAAVLGTTKTADGFRPEFYR